MLSSSFRVLRSGPHVSWYQIRIVWSPRVRALARAHRIFCDARPKGNSAGYKLQKVSVQDVGVHRQHAVREPGKGLQQAVLKQFDRLQRRGSNRNDLVILTVQD